MTISRRDLFRVFRRPDDPGADGGPEESAAAEPAADRGDAEFSLDAFYAARTPTALPPFAVKVPEATTPTTRIGLGRTETTDASATPALQARIASAMVPRVLLHRCLATTTFCSVCVERCPIEGAIVVTDGRPQVVANRCDGCGNCIAACPAPILAFELRVRAEVTP